MMELRIKDVHIRVEDRGWQVAGRRNGRPVQESYGARKRRLELKPRLYVWPEGETVWDNLAERRVRPVEEFRRMAKQALDLEAIKYERINWSQYAGCSCPCSPGFIITGTMTRGWTMSVTVEGYEPQSDADRNVIAYKVQNLQALVQGVDL